MQLSCWLCSAQGDLRGWREDCLVEDMPKFVATPEYDDSKSSPAGLRPFSLIKAEGHHLQFNSRKMRFGMASRWPRVEQILEIIDDRTNISANDKN
jgi:hypothetical protein